MSIFKYTRKPMGLGGKITVFAMNLCHRPISNWGIRFLNFPGSAHVLDCGCGGGVNIKKFLKQYPSGSVTGIDYSEISVEKARKMNRKAINNGRCEVVCASVAKMPFLEESFDLVTAFETVYFWPELLQSFREVYRVLKPNGVFMVCNECSGDNPKDDKWTKLIGGMTIYQDRELKQVMEQAGFCQVQIHKNRMDWLCIMAQK